jgi:hypothetical protein
MSSITIEWFQKMFDTTGFQRIFSFGAYPTATLAASIENDSFYLWVNGSPIISGVNLNQLENEWRHFALVFNVDNIKLYYDGVLLEAISNSFNIDVSDINMLIGTDTDEMTYFDGLITNFRWTLFENYTGVTFSIPQEPLNLGPNTVLLLRPDNEQLLETDLSNTGKTVSNFNISWTSSNPFDIWASDTGSYLLNGLDSYLEISKSSDFNFPTETTTTTSTTTLPTTTTTSTTTLPTTTTTSTTTLPTTTTTSTTTVMPVRTYSYTKRVEQIYQKVDKIAKGGSESEGEYTELIDDLLNNSEYDIFYDVMYKYYDINLDNFIDVDSVKKQTFNDVRFSTESEELESLQKIKNIKGVYQNGYYFYKSDDNTNLGTIIESEELGYITLLTKTEWIEQEIGTQTQSIFSKYEEAIDYLLLNYTTTTTTTTSTSTTTTTSTSTTTTTTSTTTLEPISSNTVEWLQYLESTENNVIFSLGESVGFIRYSVYIDINEIFVIVNNVERISTTITEYLNNWVHIAITNNLGEIKLYINGDLISSVSVNESIISTDELIIGSDGINYLNGKLTNFRWTNDLVYTNNFVVPVTPLSTLSKTILLFKASSQEKLLFNSANNLYTIENYGSTWSQSSPFSPWETEDGSIYFNGVNSYISISNLGSFNIII